MSVASGLQDSSPNCSVHSTAIWTPPEDNSVLRPSPRGFGVERGMLFFPQMAANVVREFCYTLTTPRCEKHAAPAVVTECPDSARPARQSLHRALPRASASHTLLSIESWSVGPTPPIGQPLCQGGASSKRWLLNSTYMNLRKLYESCETLPHTRHTLTSQPAPTSQPASQPACQPAAPVASCQSLPTPTSDFLAMARNKRRAASRHAA